MSWFFIHIQPRCLLCSITCNSRFLFCHSRIEEHILKNQSTNLALPHGSRTCPLGFQKSAWSTSENEVQCPSNLYDRPAMNSIAFPSFQSDSISLNFCSNFVRIFLACLPHFLPQTNCKFWQQIHLMHIELVIEKNVSFKHVFLNWCNGKVINLTRDYLGEAT